jgi:hypothetical protein
MNELPEAPTVVISADPIRKVSVSDRLNDGFAGTIKQKEKKERSSLQL